MNSRASSLLRSSHGFLCHLDTLASGSLICVYKINPFHLRLFNEHSLSSNPWCKRRRDRCFVHSCQLPVSDGLVLFEAPRSLASKTKHLQDLCARNLFPEISLVEGSDESATKTSSEN
jgi:hypothetical protein